MNNLVIFTDLHMWSMAANKGGRAFITTVESYIRDGWALTIVTTGGGGGVQSLSRFRLL